MFRRPCPQALRFQGYRTRLQSYRCLSCNYNSIKQQHGTTCSNTFYTQTDDCFKHVSPFVPAGSSLSRLQDNVTELHVFKCFCFIGLYRVWMGYYILYYIVCTSAYMVKFPHEQRLIGLFRRFPYVFIVLVLVVCSPERTP